MKDNAIHKKWMQRAISLALLGSGSTSPNPMVGAVIINRHGKLIAEGFHERTGMPHAEAMAFNNLQSNPEGGTLYVNLEPCCHHGKTPPCVNKIISSGIKTVYISIKDPDERVSGKGIKFLKKAGIKVYLGLCEKESLEINKSFIYRNLTGKAFGVLKWAMSIDGRIALKNGKSKWITNNHSRSRVHSLRAGFDAIIIGGNTLRIDDPILTSRGSKTPEPTRVVFTKTLNLPAKSNLWDCENSKTIVVYDSTSANEKYLSRIPKDVLIEKLPSDNPGLLANLLAKKGFNKVLWECGPNLATSAIKAGCIQELITFVAPKLLGGQSSMTPFSDFGFKNMEEVINIDYSGFDIISEDLVIQSSYQRRT